MEQNNLFGSDSTEWNQSESTKKISDSVVDDVKNITRKQLLKVNSSSISSEQTKVKTTTSEYVSQLKQQGETKSEYIEGHQVEGPDSSIKDYFPHWVWQPRPTTESPSYPTTVDGKEDHVTECSMSELGTVLTHEERIKLIPGAIVSANKERGDFRIENVQLADQTL